MSVLLEALKKAAEDKKRQATGITDDHPVPTPSSDRDPQDDPGRISLDLPAQTLESEEPPFAQQDEASSVDLKFNFEIPADNKAVEGVEQNQVHTTPTSVDSPETEIELLSEFTQQKPLASVAIAPQEEEQWQAEDQQELPVEVATVQETELPDGENMSDQSSQLAADEMPFQLKASEPTKPNLAEDLEARLAENEANGGASNVSPDLSTLEDSPVSQVVQNQDFVPEDKGAFEALETFYETDSVKLKANDVELQVTEDNERTLTDSDSSQREDDWSLDQIPGYQDYGLTKSQQLKTRKLLPHFSKPSESPKKWRLYVISSVLIVLGFGYYGLIYFGEQSSVIEQDLKRYQLTGQSISKPTSLPPLSQIKSKHSAIQAKTEVGVSEKALEEPANSQDKKTTTNVLTESVQPQQTQVKTIEVASKPVQSTKNYESANRIVKKESSQTNLAKPKNLHIESKQKISKESLAYTAYQAGDWQQAKHYYQQAHNENAASISALFGLGAVSVQLGEKQKALNYYRQILKLEPNNALAQKAILGIQSSENANEQTRDDLSRLSEENPNDAEVAFSLGNIYAKRGDWVSAQSYYFKAYQNDDTQANYALNLAVSLDQLGQYALAKHYYQEALAKVQPSQALFDVTAIKKRLLALNQFLEKGK